MSGPEAFNKHFSAAFGADRWTTLLPALRAPTRHAALINPFCEPAVVRDGLARSSGTLTRLPWLGVTAITSSATDNAHPFPHPERDVHNLWSYYCMDLASMMAVEALGVQKDDDVLDMCAAPGGKSLNVMYRLFTPGDSTAPRGSLTANEPSSDRRLRLRDVLHSHVPKSVHAQLNVTAMDGAAFARGHRRFTKVLIDAPCSSERHVLRDTAELAKWTPARAKSAAKRQEKLLWSGLSVLVPGGTLVYATCSLSEVENDGVVKKVLARIAKKRKQSKAAKRRGHDEDEDGEDEDEDDEWDDGSDWWNHVKVSVTRRQWPLGEPTKYGWLVLPDTADGWGPLYFCVLKCT
ncbi:NOL1/NOP2/Sun domain member 3 [Allomyces javanicus]|nr:NOL1/NOP2/Sun domain member 3 [Allomyces javanicus]